MLVCWVLKFLVLGCGFICCDSGFSDLVVWVCGLFWVLIWHLEWGLGDIRQNFGEVW